MNENLPVSSHYESIIIQNYSSYSLSFSFFFLERKKITLTIGNQFSYKKIYNVVGYLKGKRNPGLYKATADLP